MCGDRLASLSAALLAASAVSFCDAGLDFGSVLHAPIVNGERQAVRGKGTVVKVEPDSFRVLFDQPHGANAASRTET